MTVNRRRKNNTERHLVIPIFENLSGTDAAATANNRANGRLNFGRLIFHNYSSAGFQNFIHNLTREDDEDDEDDLNSRENGDVTITDQSNTSTDEPSDEVRNQPDDEVSPIFRSDDLMNETETSPEKQTSQSASFERNRKKVTVNCSDNSRLSPDREPDAALASTSRHLYPLFGDSSCSDEDAATSKKEKSETVEHSDAKQSTTRTDDDEEDDDDYCGRQPKKIPKREKLDSGISEESDDGKVSASNESSYSESTFSEAMDVESDDSDFSDYSSGETRLSSDLDFSDSKFDCDESKTSVKYRMALEKRIQALPLPNPIKTYINYDREFKFPC